MYEQQKQLRGGVIGAGVAMNVSNDVGLARSMEPHQSEVDREACRIDARIEDLRNAVARLQERLARGGVLVPYPEETNKGQAVECTNSPLASRLQAQALSVEGVANQVEALLRCLAV